MRISVIIPVFNGLKYIEDCLLSIKNQTIKNIEIEIIVIDDDSNDNLENELIDISNRLGFRFCHYLKNDKHLGPAGTRNRGILEATGDYIAFLDVDDTWEPTKLEKQLAIYKDDVAFVYTSRKNIYEDNQEKVIECLEKVNLNDILKNNHITCSSVLIKRDIITKYLMDESMITGEDYYTWIKILKDFDYAVGVNEPLVNYRVHKGSVSSNKFKQVLNRYEILSKLNLSFWKKIYYLTNYIVSGFAKYYIKKGI